MSDGMFGSSPTQLMSKSRKREIFLRALSHVGSLLAKRKPWWQSEDLATAASHAHTDHGRHWDRTCPACIATSEPSSAAADQNATQDGAA